MPDELKQLERRGEWCKIHCQEVFLARTTAMKALWLVVGVALTLVGSSITYALSTSSSLARLETVTARQSVDISHLQAKYDLIDVNIKLVLEAVTENQKMLRATKSVTR
jgi:hypothetical protein